MDFVFIGISKLVSWSYFVQHCVSFSLVFIFVANLFCNHHYRVVATRLLSTFVFLYGFRYGFYANDPTVGLFFTSLGLGMCLWSLYRTTATERTHQIVLGALLIFLLAIINYFDVFRTLNLPLKYYHIDQPFRWSVNRNYVWGVTFASLCVYGIYFYWRLKGQNKYRLLRYFSRVLFACWVAFFSFHSLDHYQSIGKGHNSAFDVFTKNIRYGLGVNAQTKYGKTRLHDAVLEQDFDEVKKLVAAGADVNILDRGTYGSKGNPAILYAMNSNYEIFEFLSENGADVNILYGGTTPLIHNTALPYAEWSGQTRVKLLKTLLENGADINALNANGDNLAHAVSMINDQDGTFLKYIASHGVDINLKNSYGRTPLHFAVSRGQIHVTRALIEHGADYTQVNRRGDTLLDIALDRQKELSKLTSDRAKKRLLNIEEVIKYLRELLSQENITDTKGSKQGYIPSN